MSHQLLVESSDGTKDFNTIELDKISLDLTNNVNITTNVNLKEEDSIVKIQSSNDLENVARGSVSSVQSSTEMIKLEEEKVYDTLKEPVIETLVK